MSNNIERSLQEAKISEKVGKKLTIQLTDKGLEKAAMAGYYKVRPQIDNLQNQIISLVAGSSVPIATQFGNSDLLVVSQRAVTDAINRIWHKISEITGEVTEGISMTVTPSYYIGQDGCEVTIAVRTVDTNGMFEKLKIYINDNLVVNEENVISYDYVTQIEETAIVRCEAQILGIEYNDQQAVIHHDAFFMGSGTSYTQVMNLAHAVPSIHSTNSVTCNAGDHIFVVIADSIREKFLRADMNGVEIVFNEGVAVEDGVRYRVFTSQNTYQTGTYNIDING